VHATALRPNAFAAALFAADPRGGLGETDVERLVTFAPSRTLLISSAAVRSSSSTATAVSRSC